MRRSERAEALRRARGSAQPSRALRGAGRAEPRRRPRLGRRWQPAAAARRTRRPGRGRPGALAALRPVSYASDASPYRLIPKAVVVARDADDVAKLLEYGRRNSIPITFRAGGTSLNGQGQSDGVLVDVRRHFRGVAVEDDGQRARVRPGTVLGHVNRVLAPHGFRLGPDPASTDIACVGGVIANNSGGMRCGVTHDSYETVRALTFVLPSGTVIDTAAAGRRAALRRRRARARSGPARDPRGDPRRRGADRPDPAQVRDQEHDRLPALRLPRRRDAGRDLPPPAGRLRGHARRSSPRRSSRPSRSRPGRRSRGCISPASTPRSSRSATSSPPAPERSS